MRAPLGTFCLVLHTHLPWLAHQGAWPVGEEWLHQAWANAYLPVVELLSRLGEKGERDVLSLAVTPVLAAQLDDAYCLREFHTWLGLWQLRAEGLARRRRPALRALARYEFRAATAALAAFEARWRHGGSSPLRALADAGVLELIGGPATHPFQPLLDERFVRFQLAVGLDDARLRFGAAPGGIWAPECGYRPGLEAVYAGLGVRRFLVDGPTLRGCTADAWTVGSSDVVAFGRDLEVTYRVWSPRRGYPRGRHYRDFHTFDHASGFRPARVTSTRTPPTDKAPYDASVARDAVARDAEDFVRVVRARLVQLADQRGRPGLVVVAYDTELFGHWWHEGPLFLEQVLRLLPAAGVRVTTLGGALEAGHVAGRRELPVGSWGSGKDWRVWNGPPVRDLVDENARVVERLLAVVDKAAQSGPRGMGRRAQLDQLAREAMLATSSDWAFMVTKDSAAGYARHRAEQHARRFHRLADLVEADRPAGRLAAGLRAVDGPFGHLDARLLAAAPKP